MPSAGWQRTDVRACEPQSPPILCLMPDSAPLHELHVGDRVMLPGECLVGPPDQGAGRLAVSVHRASTEEVSRKHLRVKPGTRTSVLIEEGERRRARIVEEQRCDARVLTP